MMPTWPAEARIDLLSANTHLYRSSHANHSSKTQLVKTFASNTLFFHGSVGNMSCDDINIFERPPDYSKWVVLNSKDPIVNKKQGLDISGPEICDAIRRAPNLSRVEITPTILEKLPKNSEYLYYVKVDDTYYTPLDVEEQYIENSTVTPDARKEHIRTWDMSKLLFVTPDIKTAEYYIRKSPHSKHGRVLTFETIRKVNLLDLTNPNVVKGLADQDAFVVKKGNVRRSSEYRKDYRLCQQICENDGVDGFYYAPLDKDRFWESEIMFCKPDQVLKLV